MWMAAWSEKTRGRQRSRPARGVDEGYAAPFAGHYNLNVELGSRAIGTYSLANMHNESGSCKAYDLQAHVSAAWEQFDEPPAAP